MTRQGVIVSSAMGQYAKATVGRFQIVLETYSHAINTGNERKEKYGIVQMINIIYYEKEKTTMGSANAWSRIISVIV